MEDMILTEEMQKIMNLIQDDENNVFVTGKPVLERLHF